jgi:hypothetical protein
LHFYPQFYFFLSPFPLFLFAASRLLTPDSLEQVVLGTDVSKTSLGRRFAKCNPERVEGLLPLPLGERIEVRGKGEFWSFDI